MEECARVEIYISFFDLTKRKGKINDSSVAREKNCATLAAFGVV